MKKPTPRDFSIPHASWRPFQYETLQKVLDTREGAITLTSAPCGSGKSAIPTGTSSRRKVVACTHTRALQAQYRDIYSFDMMTGKSNHPCIHQDALPTFTAEDCVDKRRCPEQCPYRIQKEAAMNSNRAVANYALWLTLGDRWMSDYPPDDLFLDEGHTLPDMVLGFVGTVMTAERVQRYSLPTLPTIPLSVPPSVKRNLAIAWLDSAHSAFVYLTKAYKNASKTSSRWKTYKRAEMLKRRISGTQAALLSEDEDWYIESNSQQLTIKPLTARHHFSHYFLGDHRTHIQSATIGNPEVLAKELGLPHYAYIDVPNQYTPEQRPVYILDCPRMGAASVRKNPKSLEQQADAIAKLIKQYNPSWHWLLHAQSKRKIEELLGRLSRRGLGDRLWEVPRAGTDQQLAAWEQRRRIAGTIIGSWSWSEGVDLGEVNGTIACDIPFKYLGDPYIMERMKAYPDMYKQSAAWESEQRMGRIRRGVPDHYNLNGVEKKVCAIADQNVNMIMNYLSGEFKKSLVEIG